MKKFFVIFIGLFSMGFMACNSSNQQADADETELTPVTPSDQHRYNIDAPEEQVINLDTTELDSTDMETQP